MRVDIVSSNTILYCEKWQETLYFYQSVMGLTERFSKGDWFREFLLGPGSVLSVADAARCTIKSSSGQGLTLSFQVRDLAAHHAHFRDRLDRAAENGEANPGPIVSNSWRAPYFYVFDPEGNRIEFWSEA
ncbi:MAG: hypothetical protein RQ899_11780 [Pseudomonadales bacterium]|nr:hypothetical protein [Pseudomonadales bacterium]